MGRLIAAAVGSGDKTFTTEGAGYTEGPEDFLGLAIFDGSAAVGPVRLGLSRTPCFSGFSVVTSLVFF